MLNVRLYRVSLLPVIAAMVAVAFAPVGVAGGVDESAAGWSLQWQRSPGDPRRPRPASYSPVALPARARDEALASDVAAQLRADGLVVHESSAIACHGQRQSDGSRS
jgi:mono/diheme cytochrome c family protein